MRLRDGTQLFYLRAVSILGPLTLAFAGAGIAWLLAHRSRRLAPALAVAAVALLLVGFASAQRAHYIVPSVDRELWQVRDWGRELPRGSSVRVDIRPYGAQQWAGYMLAPHPLTALDPLRKFFPYPPVGRKADYLLTNRFFSSRDVQGPPLFENRRFVLYRLKPSVPGPDRSSVELEGPAGGPGRAELRLGPREQQQRVAERRRAGP